MFGINECPKRKTNVVFHKNRNLKLKNKINADVRNYFLGYNDF